MNNDYVENQNHDHPPENAPYKSWPNQGIYTEIKRRPMKNIIPLIVLMFVMFCGWYVFYETSYSNGIDAVQNPETHTYSYQLIQLTNLDGCGSLWINPETITTLVDLDAFNDTPARTRIDTDDGDTFLVKESADFIRNLIASPPDFYIQNGKSLAYDENTGIYMLKISIERGINFAYNHQTNNLELFDPDQNTFYEDKEMYWTYWPDGVCKVLMTYKASQSLKDKMIQYSNEQHALGN